MLLTQASSSQWPRVTLQAGLSLPLKFHAWFNRVPDFKEVLSAWIGWEEHKEVQMCSKIKTVTAFVSIRAKGFSTTGRAKPSFCSQEDKHSSRESARNLHFSLLWEWWGWFGCCFKGNISFPVLSSSIACRTRAATTGSKPSLNTSLRPNAVKANNKPRIYVQKGHLAPGAGDRRAIQPRREHPTAAWEGRAAHLLSQPPLCSLPQTTAWPKHHPRSHRSRNVPKYFKKGNACLKVTRWIHTVK